MQIDPMIVHGWRFEFSDSQLLITSEDDSQHIELNARATFSLLGYLYQYRDDLHDAAAQEEDEQVKQQKEEAASMPSADLAQSD